MIVEPSSDRATRAASSLREHDFAFVRRSEGSFSYAIVAYRSTADVGGRDEKCLTFVLSRRGETKTVCERHWGACVRLVRDDPSADGRHRGAARAAVVAGGADKPPGSCRVLGVDENAWSPPTMIAFAQETHDDGCSMLSSVSDRVRAQKKGHAR